MYTFEREREEDGSRTRIRKLEHVQIKIRKVKEKYSTARVMTVQTIPRFHGKCSLALIVPVALKLDRIDLLSRSREVFLAVLCSQFSLLLSIVTFDSERPKRYQISPPSSRRNEHENFDEFEKV